jgi:PAS domain-containing protein
LVLEGIVKLLVNPMVLRMGVLFLLASGAFLLGVVLIRKLRRNLVTEAATIQQAPLASDGLPVHAFQAVIQQLKQEKHVLSAQQLAERRRAKASDTLSATVLANLSCGVLFFNTSGLVRQANAAARKFLGFASPVGLDIDDLFRGATVRGAAGQPQTGGSVRQVLAPAMSGRTAIRGLLTEYKRNDGERLLLELTASPILADDATLLGTALVLTDKTEIDRIRQEEQLRGEISSEMALGLRNSLATIAGYAQQLVQSRDPDVTRQLADDIAHEAARLDRTTVSFLAGANKASAGV